MCHFIRATPVYLKPFSNLGERLLYHITSEALVVQPQLWHDKYCLSFPIIGVNVPTWGTLLRVMSFTLA
jgi:hypothetical protein